MGLLKYIVKHDWVRCLLGGLMSAGVVYALVPDFRPMLLWTAVAIAFLIGALCSFAGETIVEAMVKVLIVSLLLCMTFPVLHKAREKAARMKEKAAERAKVEGGAVAPQSPRPGVGSALGILVSMGMGFFGGMAVGTLFGAVCRLVDETPVYQRDPTENK